MKKSTLKKMEQLKRSKLLLVLKISICVSLSILILNANLFNNDKTFLKIVSGLVDMMNHPIANYHRQQILDAHNYYRSIEAESGAEGGGAVFMLRLSYDLHLEKYAINYAREMCYKNDFNHSRIVPPFRVGGGENLYATSFDYSSNLKMFNSSRVVYYWWAERDNYNWHLDDPVVDAGNRKKAVLHWTQIVRSETSKVGCAIITGCHCLPAAGLSERLYSTYMACHYDVGNAYIYPYWAIRFPVSIPEDVAPARRTRCGNCPKGFNNCGTNTEGLKRDIYLCVGFHQPNAAAPPADLFSVSLEKKKKTSIPSWTYMIRECSVMNGGCPTNDEVGGSHCWSYSDSLKGDREPALIINQCLCNNFSTDKGVWFEKDSCIISVPKSDSFLQYSHSNHRSPSYLTDGTTARGKKTNGRLFNYDIQKKSNRNNIIGRHFNGKSSFLKNAAKPLSAVETASLASNYVDNSLFRESRAKHVDFKNNEHEKVHSLISHGIRGEEEEEYGDYNSQKAMSDKNNNYKKAMEKRKIAEPNKIERKLSVDQRSVRIKKKGGTSHYQDDEGERLKSDANGIQDKHYTAIEESEDRSNSVTSNNNRTVSGGGKAERDSAVNPVSKNIAGDLDDAASTL